MVGTETEQQSARKSIDSDAWITTDQQTTDADPTNDEVQTHQGHDRNVDTSGDSEFLDANEELDENSSTSVQHTPDGNQAVAVPPTDDPANTTSTSNERSQSFGAIDTRVSLSDIERQESRSQPSGQSSGLNNAPIGRSVSTTENLTNIGTSSRSNTRSGLRPRPQKTNRFGFSILGGPKSRKSPKK